MAAPRRHQGELEKWYLRAIPTAVTVGAGTGVLGAIVNGILATAGYANANVIPIFAAAGVAGTYLVLAVVELGGAAASRVYSGSPFTRPPPDFSYADSLAARGAYEEAVRAFDRAQEQHDDSPEPTLRAARVLRDHLGRHEDALAYLRRARSHRAVDERAEALITREIAELHINRIGDPAGTLPELARLTDRFPDTATGEWARRTLADLRSSIWDAG